MTLAMRMLAPMHLPRQVRSRQHLCEPRRRNIISGEHSALLCAIGTALVPAILAALHHHVDGSLL